MHHSLLVKDAELGGARSSVPPQASQTVDANGHRGKRVAYLVNVYPKVSHSFIRTEIEALERCGYTVERFTIRRAPDSRRRAKEDVEAARTFALLEGNTGGLVMAMARCFLASPIAFARAAVLALAGVGPTSVVRRAGYLAEAAVLADRMHRAKIRHVHAHFGTNPAAVVRLAARLSPITFSFTVHGPDEFDDPKGLDLGAKIADAAFVVAISNYGRGQLMRWSDPAHWPQIKVVRCAVSPEFASRAHDDPAGLASNRLLCVARLSAQKGLPLLIDAISRMKSRRTLELRVIGDGEDRDLLQSQICRLGLENDVHLLGWRSPAEIAAELSGARALLLPSFAEGLPVVLMEALLAGRPVIATAVAGIPELADEATGWIIPAGSIEALVTAIDACLDASSAQLAEMGRLGRARVLEMHEPNRNARELAALLAPLV